jgi:hypothetical protein
MDIGQILLRTTEIIINRNVEISFVFVVWFAREFSIHHFLALPSEPNRNNGERGFATEGSGVLGTYTNDDRFLEVKHDLFPMCVFRMGTGTKPHRLMTRFKPNIKPSDQRMNKIVPRSTKFKLRDKSEIRNSASGEINIEDAIGICDDGFKFDGIDERFSHCNSSDGRKIETVN